MKINKGKVNGTGSKMKIVHFIGGPINGKSQTIPENLTSISSPWLDDKGEEIDNDHIYKIFDISTNIIDTESNTVKIKTISLAISDNDENEILDTNLFYKYLEILQ